MLTKSLATLAAASAVTVFCSGAAFANKDFCGDAGTCQDMGVYNRSAALVTSVVITQEKTDGACDYDQRTFSQNLSGTGGDNMDGDGYEITANTNCKYKVKFKTTDGCSGDKTTHMSPNDFANDKNYVELKGACGSLDAKTK